MRDMAFLLGYIALLPAAFISSTAAFMTIVWMGTLAPWNYVYGAVNELPLYLFLFVPLGASLFISKNNFRSPISSTTFFIFLLTMWALISAAAAPAASSSSAWGRWEMLAKIAIVAFGLMAILSSRIRIHAMVAAFVLGFGYNFLDDGLKYLASGGAHVVRGIPQLGDNNSYGMVALMLAPIAYYLYKWLAMRWLRYGFLGLCLLALTTAIGTASRGTLIAMAVMGLVFVLRSQRRMQGLLIVGTIWVAIASFATTHWRDRMATIETAAEDTSFMSRVVAWKLSVVVALDRPLTGLGMDGLQANANWAAYAPRFQSLFPNDYIDPDHGRAAHSIIFETLGDLGFVGLAIYLGLLTTIFLNIRSIKATSAKLPELDWMYSLALTFELSMIAYVVAGLALSVAYIECFYTLAILIAALRRLADEARLSPIRWQESNDTLLSLAQNEAGLISKTYKRA
jgi:probable O-glycosylation ligase (exosortase A-associated)